MEIEYIKSLKKAKGLTVKQSSEMTNLSENTINNVLSGKTENPSYEVVSKLVIALGGSLDALAGAKERQQNGGEDVAAFIATTTKIYEEQIKRLQRDKIALFVLLAVIIVIVFVVLAVDILHGDGGWVRY